MVIINAELTSEHVEIQFQNNDDIHDVAVLRQTMFNTFREWGIADGLSGKGLAGKLVGKNVDYSVVFPDAPAIVEQKQVEVKIERSKLHAIASMFADTEITSPFPHDVSFKGDAAIRSWLENNTIEFSKDSNGNRKYETFAMPYKHYTLWEILLPSLEREYPKKNFSVIKTECIEQLEKMIPILELAYKHKIDVENNRIAAIVSESNKYKR